MFARLFADAFYNNGVALPQAYFEGLDANLANAVNGDGGGTYAPTGGVYIEGAGLWLCAPSILGGSGSLAVTETAGAFVLGDSDYPLFTLSQTAVTQRQINEGLGRAYSAQRYTNVNATPPTTSACGGFQTSYPGQIVRVPLDVMHQLGTVVSAVLGFYVGASHPSGAPATLPKTRVVRVDALGNLVPMSSTGAGADANGFFSPATPGSGSAWYASGGVQILTLTVDQNNVVDRSKYTYWFEWVEESGTNAFPVGVGNGNAVLGVEIAIDDILDERPATY